MHISERRGTDISSIEVEGRAVSSIVRGVGSFSDAYERRALSILEENGIPKPQPGEWYPMESYLDAFDKLAETVGPRTVTKIGTKIPDVVEWPSAVDSVESALSSVDDVYQMNHRGGEVGYYEFEKTGETEGRMVCVNPYPPELNRGLITGVVETWGDEDADVEAVFRGSRDGMQLVTYVVSWQ
ncbi:hypothetical protein ZOD2009_21502 [Haladaptatus paucihalophilus DX253]|uniref:Uncharacterized protein n=1 Tax=Haladaptatus paucihalophilus DX253 TaxID=797209 RepID=E7QZQ7_HALPU|nr:hypothetical protein [Haladaptatus paucihalophilus]EFW89801.1 hypothetical protein ZOD2009_21502 [Haladaptatus paucihalophilus DX253]SHK54789.1 hypothetical protein SAMN05444342_1629 [Haladaptatus paucihalophilus DX253]